jgi:Holliday junction resolvase RusA-like endonuclease
MFHVEQSKGFEMISIFLPMKPKEKGRPRFSSLTKTPYTPPTTKRAENAIAYMVKVYMRENEIQITDRPVTMIVTFFYKANTKKELHRYRSKRPDLDNLCKCLMDACNGIVYMDDSQIVELVARKMYGPEDGINLVIKEVEE